MKQLFMVLLLVVMSFGLCPIALAAQSDSISIKVTVAPVISVSITEDTLSLGSVAATTTTVSPTAVTIINNGSGINQNYSLSLTNPSRWTAVGDTSGIETYILNVAFDADGTDINWSEANHSLSTTPVVSSATKFAGDQTGVNVPYNATRKLWFQFKAPTATSVSTEQSIVVTVTAEAS